MVNKIIKLKSLCRFTRDVMYKWFYFAVCMLMTTRPSKGSSHGIFMHTMPKNTVGIVGKSVILDCSLSSRSVDVQWYYSADEKNYEILTKNEQFKRKSFFKKIDVLYKASSDIYVYDLRVNSIQLRDAGFYSCILLLDNRTVVKTAHLSVINVFDCRAFLNGYKLSQMCVVETSGYTDYSFSWKCNRNAEGFRGYNKTIVMNLINQMIHVQIFTLGVELNIMIDRNYQACDLEGLAINQRPFKQIHVDVDIPFFEFVMSFYQTEVIFHYNITECTVEKNGRLKLDHYYKFPNNYPKKHQINFPQALNTKFICSLKNAFVSRPMLYSSSPTTEEPLKLYASCDVKNGYKCLGFFIPYTEEDTNFLNVPKDLYNKLCDHQRDVIVCLDQIQPCFMTKKLKGLIEAYKYFCNSDFMLIRQNSVPSLKSEHCLEHYPQTMARLKRKNTMDMKFFDTTHRRAPPLHKAFCSYLSALSKSYCIEHILAQKVNLALSEWYREFFTVLKQTHENGIFSFREDLAEKHSFLIDCAGPFPTHKEEKECHFAAKCASALGLIS